MIHIYKNIEIALNKIYFFMLFIIKQKIIYMQYREIFNYFFI